MQLYALNHRGVFLSAREAIKHTDYLCLECRKTVRLRSGLQRQPHFYHLSPTSLCRQHQKGEIHLAVQRHLFCQLPHGEAQIEKPFPSIGRIADVAWLEEKLVFEVQYSPISPEEVLARTHDYRSAGWEVIWILHTHRYNKRKLTAAEKVVENIPHYFTNFNEKGEGIFYDQWDSKTPFSRQHVLEALPVIFTPETLRREKPTGRTSLKRLQQRQSEWPLYFEGDLLAQSVDSSYIQRALKIERSIVKNKRGWRWKVIAFFKTLFHFMLEKAAR